MCVELRLSCSCGSETHCGEHIRDRHPVAIIGINEARPYERVAANNESGLNREHPRVVPLKSQIQTAFHHFLDFGAEPDAPRTEGLDKAQRRRFSASNEDDVILACFDSGDYGISL